jgi:hypothetical protein
MSLAVFSFGACALFVIGAFAAGETRGVKLDE